MSSTQEKLSKLLALETSDAKLKMIWMWAKQGQIGLKDFKLLIAGSELQS